ncbi:MAG: ABC transporter permease, partial [Clostridia bacterium]|nr:ABC transporter permease [Clostridia bacterium]
MKRKRKAFSSLAELLIPLIALGILILFNLFRDPAFFSIRVAVNNAGNRVLSGNLISIIDSASELAIIAMGMTLVTAACGGQDISVGAVGAISGAVLVKILQAFGAITGPSLLIAFIGACLATILFKLFNGSLVAVFRIQPMIATLILFSCGRSIAYWINGDATPQLASPILSSIGMTIPGIPVPTPIFCVILVSVLLAL